MQSRRSGDHDLARAAQSRADRAEEITRALYECIRDRGYAATTLKDVAERAGMSPSHVGYYFENKAAILDDYTTGLCAQVLRSLPAAGEADLGRLLGAVANYFLGKGQVSTALLGVVQEISGLAVHDDRLKEVKTSHSTAIRRYFERVFGHPAARPGLSAREAAWRAHAMLVGLDSNTLFDRGLSRAKASEIFHETLCALAGLERPREGKRS